MIEECDMNIPVSRKCQRKQGMIWTKRSFASCQMFLNTKILVRLPTGLIAEDTIYFNCTIQRNQAWTNLNVYSLLVSFPGAKGSMQEAREEKNHLSWESYRLQYQPARQDVSTGAVMAWLLGDNQLHSDLKWGYSKERSYLVPQMWAKAHGWGDHRL